MRVRGTGGSVGVWVRGCVSYAKSMTEYLERTGKMGASAIAKEMGIGRASVYRALGS